MHSKDTNAGDDVFSVLSWHLPDEAATCDAGRLLANAMGEVAAGQVIYLEGDLGAGKTTLARSFIHEMGHKGSVKSPSYNLVEVYVVSNLYLYHFDFYRFGSEEEFFDAGFEEYFNEASLCLVEWPEKAALCLPLPAIRVCLSHQAKGRDITIHGYGLKGQACLNRLSLPIAR